jgi:hypothetical protein
MNPKMKPGNANAEHKLVKIPNLLRNSKIGLPVWAESEASPKIRRALKIRLNRRALRKSLFRSDGVSWAFMAPDPTGVRRTFLIEAKGLS